MEKKVAVLISTYNGEKYLKEQLDSILRQTYSNLEIVIRDDGSSDGTVAIIKEYQQKNYPIILKEEKNVGFIQSFFQLLNLAEADYYAYCDQDDVWLENKIELAVRALDSADNTKPNMVFGNSDYYDENMNLMAKGEGHKSFSFGNSLYECVAQGMTMTINQVAKQLILNHIPEECLFHDWWTYMICSGLGNVLYNDETVVQYRRLPKNATAEGQSALQIFWWRIQKLVKDNGMKAIKRQQMAYKKHFYQQLSEVDKKIMDIFVQEKYKLRNVLKKVFYPHKLRRKFQDEIMVRILFLIGVL